MANITYNKDIKKLRVQFELGKEFTRRHITTKLIEQIDKENENKFSADPEKVEIYKLITEFVKERCFPVIRRVDIAEILSGFFISEDEGDFEEEYEEDFWTLSSGRILY